jgi:hypothetical protein
MKKEDAKYRIRELWLQRPKSERTMVPDVMSFFKYLERQHPELLEFESHVDKYQVV